MFDRFKVVFSQYFLFLIFEAPVQLNALNIIAVYADDMMMMVVRPDLISPFTVTELQFAYNSLPLEKVDLAVYCCLVYRDIHFFEA